MTDHSEEDWGPWIDHDGKSWPPAPFGTLAHRVFHVPPSGGPAEGKSEFIAPIHPHEKGSWTGRSFTAQVVRYRLRISKSFKLLETLVKNPQEKNIEEKV